MKYGTNNIKPIPAVAFAILAYVLAGCTDCPGPRPKATAQPANEAPRAATTVADCVAPTQAPAKPDGAAPPPWLSPEAESNPCRTTALVLEKLLERSAQDFASTPAVSEARKREQK